MTKHEHTAAYALDAFDAMNARVNGQPVDTREASLSLPSVVSVSWTRAFEQGRALGMDYGEALDYASRVTDRPTVINPAADFDAREYNLPGHVEGLRMNDPITLASVFGILAHAAGCTGCSQCLVDGN